MTIEETVRALCHVVLNGKDDETMEFLREGMREKDTFVPTERIAREILLDLGAPDNILGHSYAMEAICLVVADWNYINCMTAMLYPKVAQKFDTTPSKAERAIRHLVEVIFTRCDYDTLVKYFGNCISFEKGKVTNGEFIARLANVTKMRMNG